MWEDHVRYIYLVSTSNKTGSILCGEPIHIRMHIGQKQRPFRPHDHCHVGVNITPTPTSLSTMRKVLLWVWNPQDRCLFLSKMTRTVYSIPGPKQNPVPGQHQGQIYLLGLPTEIGCNTTSF